MPQYIFMGGALADSAALVSASVVVIPRTSASAPWKEGI